MIYQYDQALQLPTVDLYDTQLMAMALNAAKDMYEKGEQQIKDFQKAYGDFLTPITADQNWWNQNVTGKVRDAINAMYARGGDPLRNAQDRAELSMLINNMPYGDMAKLRTSAENANEYLKERSKLEAAGLYNPTLEKYAGPGLDTFSTIDSGNAWDRMSPVPYQNMSDFSKSYFDNIQPFQRSATKNGVPYSISEINMDDLHRIADAHFNDLVQTPQGQLMYKQLLDQNGGDAEKARQNFNDAVVSGNIDRLRYSDNYDQQNLKMQDLAIKRQNLALRRQIAAARQRASRTDNGGPGTELQGISLAQSWYDTAMANAYSKTSGYTKDWDQMHNLYGDFSVEANKLFHDFGKKYAGNISSISDTDLDAAIKQYGTSDEKSILNIWKNPGLSGRTKELQNKYNKIKQKYTARINGPKAAQTVNEAYRQQFTIPMDGKSVAEIIGTPLNDNKMVAKIGEGAIDKIFGRDDIVSNTAGYTKTHTTSDTRKIRDAIRKYGVNNTTVTSMERGYGSLRKNTGSFEVNPEVKIVCTDNDGNIQFVGYGYYDIGLGSNSTKGGTYLGNYKSTGGAVDLGGYTNNPRMRIENSYRGPVEIGAQRVPGLIYTPEYSAQETNMFPDYNRWTAFGVWDTDLTSKRLHAKASENLGTYGNVYTNDDLEDLLFDEEE